MKKVVVIVGPTCSGKTNLALKLATKFPFELINGDSVQIYKELNIGSDKISQSIQNKFPHYLLNHTSIKNKYTVYDYQKDVRLYLDQLNYPLLVGGSGFYIKAALNDYQFVKEKHQCSDVDEILAKGLLEAKNYLLKKDPKIAIDFTNERKVRRAIIQLLNGVIPSENTKENNALYNALIIYLDIDKNTLREKVLARIDNQLELGFTDEVKALQLYEHNIKDILGYREMLMLIKKEITLNNYKELVCNKTMQLAKRQKTWFKNKMNINIFDASSKNLVDDVLKKIKEFYNE